MDIHQRYLKQICRVCGTRKTDGREIKSVSSILIEAFPNDAGSDVSKDSDEVSVKGLCNPCYRLLTKWYKDRSKFNLFKRKNPASPRVFSSSTVLPGNPLVYHLEHINDGCPCSQDQSHNTAATPTTSLLRRRPARQQELQGEVPGDQGGGGLGVLQGQEAVPVIPTISPGRPVSVLDQQCDDVPGDHQGAGGGGGGVQGQEEVAVQCTPSKLRKLVAEPEESPSDKRSFKQERRKQPMKLSVKFAYSKGEKNYDGDVSFSESVLTR